VKRESTKQDLRESDSKTRESVAKIAKTSVYEAAELHRIFYVVIASNRSIAVTNSAKVNRKKEVKQTSKKTPNAISDLASRFM